MKSDKPNYIKIGKIVDETPMVKTFYFDFELQSKPGQFVMLWIPGIDQKPFSIAYDNGKTFGLTIFKRGPLTNKLFEMKVGDRVGITGPFGTSFSILSNTHYIMVAGGYGAAPLGFLAECLLSPPARGGEGVVGVTADFLAGARSAEHILFENRVTKLSNAKLHLATDDGSRGHKGYVTDLLPDLIKQNPNSLVVTCGPEQMEKKVLDTCSELNANCEISIERYMKCGIGVCGQCVVDPLGICMCKQGPVVPKSLANQILEFGKYHRDKTGSIINF